MTNDPSEVSKFTKTKTGKSIIAIGAVCAAIIPIWQVSGYLAPKIFPYAYASQLKKLSDDTKQMGIDQYTRELTEARAYHKFVTKQIIKGEANGEDVSTFESLEAQAVGEIEEVQKKLDFWNDYDIEMYILGD